MARTLITRLVLISLIFLPIISVLADNPPPGTVKLKDIHDNVVTTTTANSHIGLDVNINSGSLNVSLGTMATVSQGAPNGGGANAWWVQGTLGRNWSLSSGSDSVTAEQGSAPWSFNLTELLGTALSVTNPVPTRISNGTSFVDPTQIRSLSSIIDSVSAVIIGSPTVTANAGSGTFLVNVTNASIPVTQSGAFSTGRTWTTNSATDSMTVVGTVGIAGTVPVSLTSTQITSGTISAQQLGAWSTGRTWNLSNGSDSVGSVQSGAWTTGRTWSLSSGGDSVGAVQSGTWTVGLTGGTVGIAGTAAVNIGSNGTVAIAGTHPVTVTNGTVSAQQLGTWTVGLTGGTIGAVQNGAWTTGRTWSLSSGSDTVNSVQSGTWTVGLTGGTVGIAGTASVNIGSNGTVAIGNTPTVNVSGGTIGALQVGTWTTGRTWSLSAGSDTVNSAQSGTWTVGLTGGTIGAVQNGTWTVGLTGGTVGVAGTVAVLGSGHAVLSTFTQNYSVNLSTSAFTTIISSTSADINQEDIFDTSGADYYLAYAATCGALSNSTNAIIISAGGGGKNFRIPSGNCVGFEAKTSTISSGSVNMTFYK